MSLVLEKVNVIDNEERIAVTFVNLLLHQNQMIPKLSGPKSNLR